ncbi:hypothetical protein [Streptomyces sp. YGL11-2]|uniref:hypothetical protein n=1 Tax=Streptomyces sp. YGL11-2 TaxID=3414028 RepID=UPI003CF8A9A7
MPGRSRRACRRYRHGVGGGLVGHGTGRPLAPARPDSSELDTARGLVRVGEIGCFPRIRRLTRAAAVLEHLLERPSDRPLECPVTGAHIRASVDAVLTGTEFTDDFLPDHPDAQ